MLGIMQLVVYTLYVLTFFTNGKTTIFSIVTFLWVYDYLIIVGSLVPES